VPIVRATGGLIDTVRPVKGTPEAGTPEAGTGFTFEAPNAEALADAVRRARRVYYEDPGQFRAIALRGMAGDYSWESSAQRYEDVYTWAIDARRGAPAQATS
jgi:starch synthase